jgi:ADP-ribosylglycohydrolase
MGGKTMKRKRLIQEHLLPAEVIQRADEGYELGDLPERIRAALDAGTLEESAGEFWAELDSLPLPVTGRNEPSDLDEIRGLRPDVVHNYSVALDREEIYDRIYGAWLARCAGCMLGKPVEGWSRDKIEAYLRAADDWPLHSYFPVIDPFPEGLALRPGEYETATLGNITRAERDDDTDFTVLALHIAEEFGRSFTPLDVVLALVERLPYYRVYTAEAVAYRNLLNEIDPPETARYRNPYREWIGAQIRADFWGYINPGNPELAAEMAFRDAVISHTANGIYGAMWAAACVAAAFSFDDLRGVIRAGLAEIPDECRLAEAVRDTMAWTDRASGWQEAWNMVNERYGAYHNVHVIKNTCAIVIGLMMGEGDLEKSICTTVMEGWDTDCTGATVGSIVGALRGATSLPSEWIVPLNDTLTSTVFGYENARISDLAQRTLALAEWTE